MFSHYVVWLLIVSLACLVAERVAPWRHRQKFLRPQFGQDVFWLVFNGYLVSIVFAGLMTSAANSSASVFEAVFGRTPEAIRLLADMPFVAQIAIFLIVSDFVEWLVHNALHRSTTLWAIHRVHHSIVNMDWIGNFRFHWGEILVYKTVKYLPLAVMGARGEAILVCAVISTVIGHLNHSNLNISWGPLRYVVNSPRMHIWHHEKAPRGRAGTNFAVVFSLWDWLFGTAYMPPAATQPEELGFMGMEKTSSSVWMRFFLPMVNRLPRQ